MIHLLLLTAALSFNTKCVEYHDAPMMIVTGQKNHYIVFLEGEEELCNQLASDFASGKIKRVCGCSRVTHIHLDDTVRLRCAEPFEGRMYSHTTAMYYYYPDIVPACISLRNHLMYKAK